MKSSCFRVQQVFWNVFTCSSYFFFNLENFIENEKDGNHLSDNMVNRVEQTSQNEIFFPVWFLKNVALCYHGEAQHFFLLNWAKRFLRRVYGSLFYLFQIVVDCALTVLRSRANFQLVLHGFHSTKSLKVSWSRPDERTSSGFLCHWRITRTNL